MVIDGRAIAQTHYENLQKRVVVLKEQGIIPHLLVLLVGNDTASAAYVNQKKIHAEQIGAKITIKTHEEQVSEDRLLDEITKANTDPAIHGIIVQIPLPHHLNSEKLVTAVAKEKDIDGFRTDSPFRPPVGNAVIEVLKYIHKQIQPETAFLPWPDNFSVVIIGKGKTAGQQIGKTFKKISIPYKVIDSKTENRATLLQDAAVVISAVGKSDVLHASEIKKDAIIIGVGMHREDDGKLHGDYVEEAIAKIASFYTPTPGGVGPVNVAMLLSNLVDAAEDLSYSSSE